MQVLTDADIPFDLLKQETIAIVGFGNQGHAHALNLRDSGARVLVGARSDGPSARTAANQGFDVDSIPAVVEAADIVMLSLPDEVIPDIFDTQVAPYLTAGKAVAFAHGLVVHFGLIRLPEGIDGFLVAPKGAGRWVRHTYQQGSGLAALFAVAQDATGRARDRAMAYAGGLGCGRIGIMETTFAAECETDLFGEQAVLCGGLPDLLVAGYETLVEAGYEPEMAYFECVHEAKLIIDLIVENGFDAMREAISNTAEFGGYRAGEAIVTDATRQAMRRVLADVQSGAFAQSLLADARDGGPSLSAARRSRRGHAVEAAGERVRALVAGRAVQR